MNERVERLPKIYFPRVSESVAARLGMNFHENRWRELEIKERKDRVDPAPESGEDFFQWLMSASVSN